MKKFIDILIIVFFSMLCIFIIGFLGFLFVYAISIREYGGAFVFGGILFGGIFFSLILLKEEIL